MKPRCGIDIRPLADVRAVAQPCSLIFIDYWLSLSKDGQPPAKADFDPLDVRSLMGQLVIYERLSAEHYKIRLDGTKVVARLGQDATNMNLLDLFNYSDRDGIKTCFETILDHKLGHYSIVEDRFASGRIARVEIVRLPFADPAEVPRFIISCTEEIETTGFGESNDLPTMMAERIESWYFDPHLAPTVP